MLDKLRENKRSFLINFVVGLIVVVFILWGSNQGMGQRGAIVATVNGKPVTDMQMAKAVGNRIDQMRRFGGGKAPSSAEEAKIRQDVLDQLIETELMEQEARRLQLVVSDYELQQEILQNRYLKDDNGKFDLKRYQRIVKRYPSFEQEERERLLLQKLEKFVRGTVQVTDADLQEIFEEQNTKVDLEYAKFQGSTFSKGIQVTPEERAAFIKDRMPEVQARYERDLERIYRQPKKVKASHILLKLEESDTPELKEQLRKKMDEIKTQTASRDFAELARQYSEDPGSTARGGDLGLFEEKRMDPAFSKVAFSTPKGQISDVVESKFGFHLIKVEDIQEPSEKKLAEVQEEIATHLINEEKGPGLARAAAEKVKDAWVKKSPELEGLLKTSDVTVQTTGMTSRMGDTLRGLGRSTELADAAFALRQGDPAPDRIFTVGEGGAKSEILIRLKERQEANLAEFEAQKDKLRTQARRQKEQSVMEAWVDSLKAKARINVEQEYAADAPAAPAA